MTQQVSDKYKDIGLLILRVGIGVTFVLIHGYPKIIGGPALWTRLGGAMGNFGFSFAPEFWGLMAALAEFGGGLLLIFGLFTRPAAFIMAINMIVATSSHFARLDAWSGVSHPLKLAFVFIALVFFGAGKYSLDRLIFKKRHDAEKKTVEPNPEEPG